MRVHWIRSWQLPGYSRRSSCPLSSLNGFTLELLKVSHVCARTAAVGSAVARNSLFTGAGGSSTLGWLWRSLLLTCLTVPRRNRRIYWGYVEYSVNGALVEWVLVVKGIDYL